MADGWNCIVCGRENPFHAVKCEFCEAPRVGKTLLISDPVWAGWRALADLMGVVQFRAHLMTDGQAEEVRSALEGAERRIREIVAQLYGPG